MRSSLQRVLRCFKPGMQTATFFKAWCHLFLGHPPVAKPVKEEEAWQKLSLSSDASNRYCSSWRHASMIHRPQRILCLTHGLTYVQVRDLTDEHNVSTNQLLRFFRYCMVMRFWNDNVLTFQNCFLRITDWQSAKNQWNVFTKRRHDTDTKKKRKKKRVKHLDSKYLQ